jgi:hypothetical protein
VFQDIDVSAFNGRHRPGFTSMMARLHEFCALSPESLEEPALKAGACSAWRLLGAEKGRARRGWFSSQEPLASTPMKQARLTSPLTVNELRVIAPRARGCQTLIEICPADAYQSGREHRTHLLASGPGRERSARA